MDIRFLILSLACASCLVPVYSKPSEGLAQAAYDIAAAKAGALVAAKTAIVKGAASLAVKGAAIGSSVILGAIAGGLNATAEAFKPAEDSHTPDNSPGVIDKFSKVIELKQQFVQNLLEGHTEKPKHHEETRIFIKPIAVQEMVRIPSSPAFLTQDLPVLDVVQNDEVDCDSEPLRVLPQPLYHLPPPFPLRRLMRRGQSLNFIRNYRLH